MREMAQDEGKIREKITGAVNSCGSGRNVSVVLAENTACSVGWGVCVIIPA